MKRIDIVRRAGRNLRQAKGRTLLTSLAIAVGAFTITLSLAAGEGARQYADKLITSNVDPQSIFVTKESITGGTMTGLKKYDDTSMSSNGVTIQMVSTKDIKTLQSIPNVTKVVPYYSVNAQYVTFSGSSQRYSATIAMYDATIRSSTAAGALPVIGLQIGSKEVVVPQSFADTLGVSANELVGRTVTLHVVRSVVQPTSEQLQAAYISGGSAAAQTLFQPESRDITLTIRAVTGKSDTAFSSSDDLLLSDTKAAEISDFLHKNTAQSGLYGSATILVKDGVNPTTVKDVIEKQGFHAMTAKDMSGMIFKLVDILQGIVVGFGVLALIASVFGIVNTQYISVLERTSQIGLMKALGMPKRDVAKLFRYEAAWIGFIGAAIGVAFAYSIGTVLNPWITSTLSLGKENYLLIFVWWHSALLILGLMFIAIIAGWFPSRKAAKLDPIEALRTE